MQANQWLYKMSVGKNGKESVKIIKPTTDQKLMSRIIENAMSLGYVVIFEDANETFDPMLDPLLSKQLKKQGSEWMIKFGDGLKTYSLDFKFYITTKISRPHYSPEICVKVSMINFMVTPEGLLEQISSRILQIEEVKKYEMREKTIAQTAEAER
jgi:dynein heavy chain